MPRFETLITDRFDIDALALLRGDERLNVKQSTEPRPTPEDLAPVEGLIIRSRTRIDAELLAMAPRLKVVVTSTSGYDHIDLLETSARGIRVMFTPNANAASAAELTWTLILACARRLLDAHRAVKAGDWRRDALTGRQLSGKTIGIVGLGRIGSRVARVAQAFGMSVIAFDPYKEDEHFAAFAATRVAFDELLRMADVVTFHVPATIETRDMISSAHLQEMNPNAILVNTSRGAVVAEKDLVAALANRWIGACGLDVYEREPLPRQSELIKFPNVVLSPHLGATTTEAFAAASREAASKLQAFVTNGAVSDTLPQDAYLGHRADKAGI